MYDMYGPSADTTIPFICLIIIVTIFFQIRYNPRDLNYGPIILTMLGILGCFLGIALGLLNFDTTKVQDSVPSLLAGLRTSFWASITGIIGALTIKARYQIFLAPRA
jgi:hypothetical protein